jgi:hypothetical protein
MGLLILDDMRSLQRTEGRQAEQDLLHAFVGPLAQKNFYSRSGLGEEARGLLVQILGIQGAIAQEISQWKLAALASPQHGISISRLALVKRTHLGHGTVQEMVGIGSSLYLEDLFASIDA